MMLVPHLPAFPISSDFTPGGLASRINVSEGGGFRAGSRDGVSDWKAGSGGTPIRSDRGSLAARRGTVSSGAALYLHPSPEMAAPLKGYGLVPTGSMPADSSPKRRTL
jgi:hypothetical protein